MHVTNAYVILFLASAKTGDTGIHRKVYYTDIVKDCHLGLVRKNFLFL